MTRIDSANPYRVQGTIISFAELAKTKPGFIIAATPEQIAELKLHEEQMQAREAATARYAAENPSNIYAQVIVDGKVFATVYDSGFTSTQYAIAGLSEDFAGLGLAKRRLGEIVKAVEGQIVYSGFQPPPGQPPSTMTEAAERALPQVTARGLSEIMQEMMLARAHASAGDTSKK